MKKSKMTWSRALVGSAVVLAFLMAGCEIVSAPSEAYLQPNGGTGSVTLNIGLAGAVPVAGDPALSRTVYPTGEGDDDGLDGYITKYVVSFTGGTHANEEATAGENNTASVTIDDLAEGTYTVTVTGYAMLGEQGQETETEVAKGSVSDVTITAGQAADQNTKSVILGPSGNGKGTFSYTLTFPAVDSGKLYIYGQDGEPLKDGENDVVKDLVSGTKGTLENLKAGTYQVAALLTIGTDVAWRGETVHVYAGKTSPWTHEFTADEFLPPSSIEAFALDSLFAAPVIGETAATDLTIAEGSYYTGSIAWADDDDHTGPFAEKTAYTATVTLKAKPGYTFEGILATAFTYIGTAGTGATGAGDTIAVSIVFAKTGETVNLLTLGALFDAPKTDETPDANITATAQYTGTIAWSYGVGQSLSGEFEPETAYTATLSLTALSDYTFHGVTDSFVYGGAGSVTNGAIAEDGKSMEVTVVFADTTARVNLAGLALTDLFAAPETGEESSNELGEADNFTGSIVWKYGADLASTLEEKAEFAPKTAYTAVVTLNAKPGYSFAEIAKSTEQSTFTYEGAKSVANEKGEVKTIEVTVAFAAIEGSLKITIGLITYGDIPVTLDSVDLEDVPTLAWDDEEKNAVFGVKDDAGYTNIKWHNGKEESANTLTLTKTSLLEKTHSVTVIAEKGGVPYSTEVKFEVKETSE